MFATNDSHRPFDIQSARCRSAQRAWTECPISQRLKSIRSFRYLLVERANDLAKAAHDDVHRDPDEFVGTDLLPTAAAMKFLEQRAKSLLKPMRAGRPPLWLWGSRDTIFRRAFGVVGVIGTWNYPLFLNAVPIFQAVTAGNGVLWKPSEWIPRTSKLLTALFAEAGLPQDLIIRLPDSREAGPQLAEAEIDFLHFTGSETVGRQLAARLGERLIPSTLELSGHDACFVLADADPTFAARIVWYGTTLNAGQTCLAVRRVFIERAVYDPFVNALRTLVESSPPFELVLPSQRELVALLRSRARDLNLQTISDPRSPNPVLFLLDPPDEFGNTPCFAPIASIIPFDSLDEAIQKHESSRFGLAASIITNDLEKGRNLAEKLTLGHVTVNDVIVPTAHPGTPLTARKASGWGSTQGEDGLRSFTVPQVMSVRSGTFRPHVDNLIAPDPAAVAITRGLLSATHAKGVRARLAGAWTMLRGIIRSGKSKQEIPTRE